MIDRQLNYGRTQIIKMASEALKGTAAAKPLVLDVGAGSGDDLLGIKGVIPAAELYGIESFGPNVQKLAAQKVIVHSLNVEKEKFPFSDSELDLIVSNQTLEHVKEIFWILHEISRTLKVGGSFLLGVPNLASLHNRLLLLMGQQPSPIKSHSAHVRGFTKGDILKLMECGFPGGYELVDFKGSNFYPFPKQIAKPLANLWPAGAWAIFMLFKKAKPYEKSFLEFPLNANLETNFYLGSE